MFAYEGRLNDRVVSSDAMLSVFAPRSTVQRMLDVEAALARALASAGVIPADALAPIETACDADLIDADAMTLAAASAGNLAIPLVKQLTACVAQGAPDAAKYVHWGATSQDIIDSGMVLQLRDALDLIEAGVDTLCDVLARQAAAYRDTPMIGRTWLQQALPITLGLKFAQWLDALERHRVRLEQLRERAVALQFGGAAGTLASLGDAAQTVAQALARELALPLPSVPWHTQRDRIAEAATVLGLLTATLGKIARDVSLQMQTEVGEMAEPSSSGKGGSSTMPHKRNPSTCEAVMGVSRAIKYNVALMLESMVIDHERDGAAWRSEWRALPEACLMAGGMLATMKYVISGLVVNVDKMRSNLDLLGGFLLSERVMFALADKVGKQSAHELVYEISMHGIEHGISFEQALMADKRVRDAMSETELRATLDPTTYVGLAPEIVDEVLAQTQKNGWLN